MPSNYKTNDPYVNEQVDLDDVFITDAWLLDQFVGGTLFGWGSGAWGNMGIGAAGPQGFIYYSSPVQVGSLSNWKQVTCSTEATGAVKTDGTLWMWGNQYYGQVGNGVNADIRYSSPIQIGSLTNWKQVSLGIDYTAAVKTDGSLWTWGGGAAGSFGYLGTGDTTTKYSPNQVGNLYDWNQVSARLYTVLAVKTNGTLWSWGWNPHGQLGNGTTTNYSSPIQIGSLSNWKQISNYYQCIAIKTDGTLWGWGYNSSGELGLGDHPSTAVFNTSNAGGPKQVAGGSTWSNTDPDTTILYTGPGSYTTFAIDKNGALWGWGIGTQGALGNGATVNYSSPIQIGSLTNWRQASSGFYTNRGMFGVATKTDNTLWAWGYNIGGVLGNNTTTNYSSPIQVGSLTNWKQVAAGGTGYFVAVKTDGTLWSCGYNYYGNLGNGTNFYSNSYSSPIQIGSLTNWKQVACGYNFSGAVKTDGTLWGWGRNNYGQLGNNTTTDYSSPIQIGPLSNWKQVACGTYNTMAAVKTDGTLWTWGVGQSGELGNGTTGFYSSPIQVGSLTNWKQVSCGQYSMAATKTDGTLWAWGNDGYSSSSSSPVQVGTSTNWSQVNCGYFSKYAYTSDNKLYAYGRNQYGQLGIVASYTNNISSPIQIGSLANWKQVACGRSTTAAIKTDGTLWTWGYNTYGTLGNGATDNYSSPVQVGSLTNWKQVACGYSHMAAIKTDGTLWTWGQNNLSTGGQLGNGTTVSYSSPIQIGSLTNWKQAAGLKTTFAITFKDIG